jgi:hypothetical protein
MRNKTGMIQTKVANKQEGEKVERNKQSRLEEQYS